MHMNIIFATTKFFANAQDVAIIQVLKTNIKSLQFRETTHDYGPARILPSKAVALHALIATAFQRR